MTMLKIPMQLVLAYALVGQAIAEDIDIFTIGAGPTAGKPNVLFMLDNSANWNGNIGADTKKALEHAALYDVVTDPGLTDSFNAGLMVFAHGNSPRGGKIIKAVKPLDAAYQTTLGAAIYDGGGNEVLPQGNNAPYALGFNEAYLYFGGKAPASGTQDNASKGLHDPDATDASDSYYVSPVVDSCAKNFVILVANGEPDSGENNPAESELNGLGGVLPSDPISVSPSNFASNWSDEYARYMSGNDVVPDSIQVGDQYVYTYVVDVYDPNSNQKNTNKFKAARSWLKSIAQRGKGRYFPAASAADVKAALYEILNEIQAVNSVFASTSVPVSINVRGTNVNQVYMGVFRPDAANQPRWFGNLKLFELGVDASTDEVFLADSVGNRADSAVSGFIVPTAVSYWTSPSTFWDYDPRGQPLSGSDSPDGEVVEKGGAGQGIRNDYATRNVYTCTTGCVGNSLLSATSFVTGNASITQAALGAADATERSNIIDWVRGVDNLDENGDGLFTDARPSVHGDVIHSRPAVVNYNRYGNENDVIVFYGANDGVFHAVKGGKGALDGYELWGFVAPEHFDKLKRLRDNSAINATNGPKPYFFDGSITAYTEDVNSDGKLVAADGDKVYVYATMRRGGRGIYAFDVSDPAVPRLLWHKDNTSTGYAELGQSWSDPAVAKIAASADPVLIFGGGYDAVAEDVLPATADTMGRAIFVVNAVTGDVIWQAGPSPVGGLYTATVAGMTYSIPSEVTVLNRDFDSNGYIDRLYVGDVGGNVWRVDTNDADPSNWRVHKLATIGSARKFLYAPDVVYTQYYDAVTIGTGDREKPLDTTITNRFYMFKDTANSASIAASITTLVEGDLTDVTQNLLQVGTAAQQLAAASALGASQGWYITFSNGEKVVTSSITLSGTTFFNTNEPTPIALTSCTGSLGTARSYAVNFADATATIDSNGISGLTTEDRFKTVPGGGFPPSPVPVVVELNGKKYQAVISGTQVQNAPGVKLEARLRTFWHRTIE